MMKPNSTRIMIIDDEPDMLNGACLIFKSLGYSPVGLSSGKLAVELLQREAFDLILCDLLMPEMDGMAVLASAQKYAPYSPFIIFTAYATIDRAVQAMQSGAFDFLEKPIEVDKLRMTLEKGLRQRQFYLERENLLNQLDTKYSFDNIIGKSSPMRHVFDMVESIASSESNIFITGESGTGKELIARSIHARSPRKLKAFVPVNCGAFPEHLFEAELFGYEKGAFTGAAQKKKGLLEFATGGTFFLDEVCELPLTLQAKMLRTLQDQQLRRLGGNELIQVNVRFISASNRDMDAMLKNGNLREDFYYRLNVINIHMPPLRDRVEDIPLLSEHFLRNYLQSSPKTIQGIDENAMNSLLLYSWPGNVRELENTIERAVTFAKTEQITLHDLPTEIRGKNLEDGLNITGRTMAEAKKLAVEKVEKDFLFQLLKKHQGNITRVAEEAGMTRRNIHRLLNRYDLDPNIWR